MVRGSLCRSLAGNVVPLLTITDFHASVAERRARPCVRQRAWRYAFAVVAMCISECARACPYAFADVHAHACAVRAGSPVGLTPPPPHRLGRYVVLSSRVHPGETNASWMMRGIVDFLTSSHPSAAALRGAFVFLLVPFLNPDGVINGHHRTGLAGVDLNRHWTAPDRERTPTVCVRAHSTYAFPARAPIRHMHFPHGRPFDICKPG